jgi:hypothetical protein
MKRALGSDRRGLCGLLGAVAAISALASGCSADESPKAWNALSTCLAGKAAQKPLAERFKELRLIQLANPSSPGNKEAWPARCARYADQLFAALPSSGEVMRRQMQQKLGCAEGKSTCTLPADGTIGTLATELWSSAETAGLKAEPASDVPAPAAAPAPTFDSPGWKSFSDKPVAMSGPALTDDGRAVLVLKGREGRSRPKGCEFSAGFAKVRCVEANAKVPELPGQTVELVSDPKGLFASALTEQGLVAYDLESGATSDVRGSGRRLTRSGVAVEKGAQEELLPPGSMPPPPGPKGKKAKGTIKEEGFVAVEVVDGKASKEVKLPIKASLGDPIAVGNQVVFLVPTEKGADLVAQSVSRGRLKSTGTLKGSFSGALHSCRSGEQLVVAAYGPRAGQQKAAATGGAGKTQLTLSIFSGGAWSKPVEATLPFERGYDSDLICTKQGATVVWVQSAEGGAQVGRVDCSADGCKASDAKLPGVQSSWWWAAGPIGDKVLLSWRGPLGETHLRAASIADLPTAKDTLLFDSPDFGGPTAGEVSPLFTDAAALLVFRNEEPVALQVTSDGAPHLLKP